MLKSLVGTPLYMAPQILIKIKYTGKCDIWSLGVIYYEVLTGVMPFVAIDQDDLVKKVMNF